MRTELEVVQVLSLARDGVSNCAISRLTGIPRTTVRDWVRGRNPRVSCRRCGGPEHVFEELPPGPYADLLGMYLGDGFLAQSRRGVYVLRITLDERYPAVIAECQSAAQAVLAANRVSIRRRPGEGCAEVQVSSKTLVCLFPQHGRGPKHRRPIRLAPWQQRIVRCEPESLLRGLIHSDGCRFTNTVRHGARIYTYPRYTFSNASADIRHLFCATCDVLGIEWRQMNARNVSVARRASVARLDQFVGPKR